MSRESFGRFQRALAALLYEPNERAAYARAPEAWLATRGLSAQDQERLASIPVARLDSFHEIIARDRASVLVQLFTRTLARAGSDDILPRYFAAVPFGHDDRRVECERFAAWARGALDDASADLAAYESALVTLDAEAALAPDATAHRVKLSPNVRILEVRTNVPELVDDASVAPRAEPGWIIMVRTEEGVTSAALADATAKRLLSCAQPVDATTVEGVDELLRLGVLIAA